MTQLEIYKKNQNPPEWAKKTIQAGRTKGMTDINPQWRITALTETFGICGFGWKYTIDRQWLEVGAGNSICAFVNISLYVKIDGEWSEPIPANGGSQLISTESKGDYTNDEAFKMALTDAFSVACKMVGIGSAIYSGSKYMEIQSRQIQPKKKITPENFEIFKAKFTEAPANYLERLQVTDFTPEQKQVIYSISESFEENLKVTIYSLLT